MWLSKGSKMNSGTQGVIPSEASIFRIRVRGALDPSWSDYLGGMALSHVHENGPMTVIALVGSLEDQSALLGVLNTIHSLGLALLSVEQVSGKPFSEQTDNEIRD